MISSTNCLAVGLLHHGNGSSFFHLIFDTYSFNSNNPLLPLYGRTSLSCILLERERERQVLLGRHFIIGMSRIKQAYKLDIPN